MNNGKALSWDWAESSIIETELQQKTREIAIDMGADPVSPGTGAALRMLAAACGAKAVIEIGTGAGVSGLYFLQGMTAGGVLTGIDSEAEYLKYAKQAFQSYKIAAGQCRLINGHALKVLPRMAKAAYDIILLDADEREIPAYINHAVPMLRPGGMLVIPHATWNDQVGDPARREAPTVAMRTAINGLLNDERFITNILTCGDGLAVAVLR